MPATANSAAATSSATPIRANHVRFMSVSFSRGMHITVRGGRGGDVNVSSRPREGRAHLVLTCACHTVGPMAAAHTLLLAEDDRAVRQSLVRALELEGYAVHAVGNGAEALEVAKNVRP